MKTQITGMLVGLFVALAVVLSQGCLGHTVHSYNHNHKMAKAPIQLAVKNPRCKKLGQVVTKNVSVLVERNCFRNGVTTVGIVVHNKTDNGKAAAQDSVLAVTRILGFRPKLTTLFLGKTQGQLFMLSVVTGYWARGEVAIRR